ncbi:hypothetical protein ACTXT7_012568 [Hymenolepis weldensis]
MKQMNLSKPEKDLEDYVKNFGEFHYEPSTGELFGTWYARNRDVYGHRMAGARTAIRTTTRKDFARAVNGDRA